MPHSRKPRPKQVDVDLLALAILNVKQRSRRSRKRTLIAIKRKISFWYVRDGKRMIAYPNYALRNPDVALAYKQLAKGH